MLSLAAEENGYSLNNIKTTFTSTHYQEYSPVNAFFKTYFVHSTDV